MASLPGSRANPAHELASIADGSDDSNGQAGVV